MIYNGNTVGANRKPYRQLVIFVYASFVSIVFCILLFSSFNLQGQNPKSKQLAYTYFNKKAYTSAIPFLRKAVKQNPHDDTVITKLVYSYFYTRQLPKAKKVFQYMEQQHSLNDSLLPLYFEILKQMGQYKEAKRLVAKKDTEHWKDKVQSCDSAMAWLKKTKPVKVQNLKYINTEYSEKSPSIHPTGLLFLSNRESVIIEKTTGNDGLPSLDLYLAKYGQDSVPISPTPFPKLHKTNYHDGEVYYASDTSFVYFSQAQRDRDNVLRMKLYESEMKNGKPRKIKSFVFNDSLYSFLHPCTDKSNQLFFFSSNMPGGFGGMDLYVSIKIDSAWQDPVNLGPTINTACNEIHPYFDSGHQLYFSSDRPTGMGGYDIYVATEKKGRWERTQNLRVPINSCSDDMGFVLNQKQSAGYFYSNRASGMGKEDIYKATGKLFLLLDK